MQRTNLLLLLAVLVGIAIMTFYRLTAEEIVPLPTGPSPADVSDGGGAGEGDGAGGPSPDFPVDGVRVMVQVAAREQYVAPIPPRLVGVELPHRTPLPTSMLAGTGANPWAKDRRPGFALVKVAIDGGFVVRQGAVAAAGRSEVRIGSSLTVSGSVRDEQGRALVGARVWFGELDADGRTRHLRTDEEGRFSTAIRGGDGVPLTVWADGYAATWRPVRVSVDDNRDFAITLSKGRELRYQLAGTATAVELAEVFVAPAAQVGAQLSRYPFFLQGLVGGAAIDATGRGLTAFLPERGELTLAVLHPLVAIRRHHEVELSRQREPCVVPLEFRPEWRLRLVDESGAGIAGGRALLRPEARAVSASGGLRLLPPILDARGCHGATADAEGRMLLARPATGDVLALRAVGYAGRDLTLGEELPEAVTLPRWQGGEPSIVLQPPIAGQVWRAEFDLSGGVTIDREPGADAVVSLPHAGRFDLVVITFQGEREVGRRTLENVVATGPVTIEPSKID